jgi:hypothetical protein
MLLSKNLSLHQLHIGQLWKVNCFQVYCCSSIWVEGVTSKYRQILCRLINQPKFWEGEVFSFLSSVLVFLTKSVVSTCASCQDQRIPAKNFEFFSKKSNLVHRYQNGWYLFYYSSIVPFGIVRLGQNFQNRIGFHYRTLQV